MSKETDHILVPIPTKAISIRYLPNDNDDIEEADDDMFDIPHWLNSPPLLEKPIVDEDISKSIYVVDENKIYQDHKRLCITDLMKKRKYYCEEKRYNNKCIEYSSIRSLTLMDKFYICRKLFIIRKGLIKGK